MEQLYLTVIKKKKPEEGLENKLHVSIQPKFLANWMCKLLEVIVSMCGSC